MRAVTKGEFEAMIRGLGPRAAAADKAKIAEFYAHALAIENQARKINLEKTDPDLAELLWMARIGALGDALHRHLQKQFENVPDSEVQAFYDQHKADFEEATIQRVVIPKPPKPAAAVTTPPAKPGEKPAEAAPESPSNAKANDQQAYTEKLAALKTTAEKMLERAKAGEDLAKLQQEAFTAAGMQGKPPDMEPVAIHHNMLPPAHDQKVFALQAGQYTDLIEEPNAYMFYKVVSRRTIPLAEVKEEIKQNLATENEDRIADQFFSESKPILVPGYFAPQKPEKPAAGEKPEAQPESPQSEAAPEQPKAEQPQQPAPKQEQSSEPPKQEQPSAPPK
jgi:hypothetical protein